MRLGIIIILIVGWVASWDLLNAQSGNPIVKAITVQYVGAQLIPPQEITRQMATRIGQPLSVQQADQDLKSLYRSGKVTNARFLQEQAKGGGVNLIVIVECRAIYGGVQFQGNSVLPDRKLQRLMEHPENQPLDTAVLRKTSQEIIALYRRKGFPNVTVNYTITKPNPSGQAMVVYTINEQSQGVLRHVSFRGNSALSPTQLKAVMSQKERGLQNIVGRGGRTDAPSIADDVKEIEGIYRDHGYFQAKVIQVAKMPVDGRRDDIVFHINEGRNYQVSKLTVDGVKALSYERDIAPYLKTQSGSSFSAENLQADIDMITKQYHAKGFTNIRVTPVLVEP